MSISQICRETKELYEVLDEPRYRIFECEPLHTAFKVSACTFTFFTSSVYLAWLRVTG